MQQPLTQNIDLKRGPLSLKEYEKVGGYASVHKALKQMTPQEITKLVTDSNLKGRGGAGFNTGLKWSFVPMGDNVHLSQNTLIVNADEMEPGTFKDRLLLEGDPHQMIEGMIVAALCYTGFRIIYLFTVGL